MMSPTSFLIATLLLVGSTTALLSSPSGLHRRDLGTPNYDAAPTLFFQDVNVCSSFFSQWNFKDGDACSAVDRCNDVNGIALFSSDNELCTIEPDYTNFPNASKVSFVHADPTRFERLAFTVWANDVVGAENCRTQYTKVERGTAPQICPPFHQCVTCGDNSGIRWVSVALSPSAFH